MLLFQEVVETIPATIPWYGTLLISFVATIPLIIAAIFNGIRLSKIKTTTDESHTLANSAYTKLEEVNALLRQYGVVLKAQLVDAGIPVSEPDPPPEALNPTTQD